MNRRIRKKKSKQYRKDMIKEKTLSIVPLKLKEAFYRATGDFIQADICAVQAGMILAQPIDREHYIRERDKKIKAGGILLRPNHKE